MSKDPGVDIANSLKDAAKAWGDFMSTVAIFQANCQRGEFEAAKAERPRIHAMIDANLDSFAAANKRAAVANG